MGLLRGMRARTFCPTETAVASRPALLSLVPRDPGSAKVWSFCIPRVCHDVTIVSRRHDASPAVFPQLRPAAEELAISPEAVPKLTDRQATPAFSEKQAPVVHHGMKIVGQMVHIRGPCRSSSPATSPETPYSRETDRRTVRADELTASLFVRPVGPPPTGCHDLRESTISANPQTMATPATTAPIPTIPAVNPHRSMAAPRSGVRTAPASLLAKK